MERGFSGLRVDLRLPLDAFSDGNLSLVSCVYKERDALRKAVLAFHSCDWLIRGRSSGEALNFWSLRDTPGTVKRFSFKLKKNVSFLLVVQNNRL